MLSKKKKSEQKNKDKKGSNVTVSKGNRAMNWNLITTRYRKILVCASQNLDITHVYALYF